ncbi:MAG TPA: cytidylate kinase-like family protein, partial [Actinomycetota bacterium]|nr:cytidylate kinase-like family protein [Actinomycetota bacterium]
LEAADYEARRRGRSPAPHVGRPVITISRKAGSGAHVVAQELIGRLQAGDPKASPPWTVFDRNLVAQVLREHDLPERLAGSMPEDRVSEIADILDGLFGLRPSSWALVRKTADTILHLAEIGNVIVIGRGANILTDRLPGALHVRLIGSVRRRVEHIEEVLDLDPHAAAEYVRTKDQERKRYVTKYYGKDIDDPLLYHLVINTDRVTYAEAAHVISGALSAHLDASGRVAGRAARAVPLSA